MAQLVARGALGTFDAYFKNGSGVATDPSNPKVSIVDPDGGTVVLLDDPTRHVSTGHYQYDYTPADDAMLGGWAIIWYGTIAGSALDDEDAFTVVVAGSISTPGDSGCEAWLTWDDLDCDEAADITDEAVQELLLGYASDVLYRLSCGQFGVCTVTARPCQGKSFRWPWWGGSISSWDGYYPSGGYGCTGCGRGGVELGSAPIIDVLEVKVDGEILDSSAYQVNDNWELVRLDGLRWPRFQDLLLDDTEVGTWSVTWRYGAEVPNGGILSAKLYVCELIKAYLGQDCALPPGTTSASRDGVTVNIIDANEAAASGKTGIVIVDLWLETVCPGGPTAQSGAMDPGRRGRRSVRTDT